MIDTCTCIKSDNVFIMFSISNYRDFSCQAIIEDSSRVSIAIELAE